MVLMEKTVVKFAQTAVTRSVIKIRAIVFVKPVAGEFFATRHVLHSVIKTHVIPKQAIVQVVFLDIME